MSLPLVGPLIFYFSFAPDIATAVSLNHDVDTDKELVAHGYSNLLAGAFGTV